MDLHGAALLLGGATVASQLLGLIRDRLFAQTFGVERTLDIYYSAFRVPDLVFAIVASLFSAAIVIPFFVSARQRDGVDGGASSRELFDSLVTVFAAIMIAVSAVVFAVMPKLAELVAPGFSPEDTTALVSLSRILLLSPVLLGLSNLFAAVTQSFERFALFALAPILYNAGIIAGILFLYPSFGIAGLGFGVVLGAFLHGAIQLPALAAAGYLPRMRRPNMAVVRRVFFSSVPRTAALSFSQITIAVFAAVASLSGVGSVAAFQLGFNLQSVPLGIVGVSYATAVFPTLARFFAEGNMPLFAARARETLGHVIVWSLPLTALFIALRTHIVRVVLGNGPVGSDDVERIALTMSFFIVSLVAQSLILVASRIFYAIGNTRVPVVANFLGAVVSVGVGLFAVRSFPELDAVLVLAGTFSLGMLSAMAILLYRLRQSIPDTHSGRAWAESFLAALAAWGVTTVLSGYLDGYFGPGVGGVFAVGAFAGLVGLAAAGLILFVCGNKEIRVVIASDSETISK